MNITINSTEKTIPNIAEVLKPLEEGSGIGFGD